MKVRTRIAPSPTGYAHLGLLSRVLVDYALAKKNKGQFIWRNEDTDQERFVENALEFNMKWMREFGLDWDEGPDKGGPYAPYTQTERLPMYKETWEKLIENDYAYRCFCSKERLDKLREEQSKRKERTRYDGLCRNLSKDETEEKLKNNEAYTIRLKVPKDKKIEYTDLITKTHIVWDSNEVDDYILVKSNGIPTYHLAAMVDDIAMKITHALRGSEWLATTPVHMLVFEGLGVKPDDRPGIGHFTVILDPETPGKKFSKRNSAFKINGLVIQGYLKPAILNYLMLLGWAPKDNRELFTLEEFVEAFDLAGMQKSNPTWDPKKMDWFNGVYARKLLKDEFADEFLNWIEKYLLTASEEDITSALIKDESEKKNVFELIKFAESLLKESKVELSEQLALVQERSVNFFDSLKQIEFFYKRPEKIDWEIKQVKNVKDKVKEIAQDLYTMVEGLSDDSMSWSHEEWENEVRKIGDKFQAKHGDVFMVLRLLIVGAPFSPPLFESMQILGKNECLERIKSQL